MDELVEKIISAKKEIEAARKIKCTCSGFVLQYEGGCWCERSRILGEAEAKMQNIIISVK